MITKAVYITTLIAAVGSGLIGGVFFAFSTFVLRAIARRPPAEGIAVMQAINVDVVRSGFLPTFVATAGTSLALIASAFARRQAAGNGYLLAGGVLYLIGSFGVTAICNVPLNTKLAALAPLGSGSADAWASYVREWSRWNHVRTLASLGAMVMYVLALLQTAHAE